VPPGPAPGLPPPTFPPNAPAACSVPGAAADTLRLLRPSIPCPARPHLSEAAIASEPGTSRAVAAWIDAWQPEDQPLLSARQRAAEVGVAAVDPATGAVLRLLAAATRAKAVVELGTGTGVSALWLLRGMRADGVLTSVDSEPEHQRLAKQSIGEAGVASGRARLISGRALEVMPRLSDGAYDLVFCDAARSENLDYLEGAVRLLRPGGCVVFAGALAGGKVADPAARDNETIGLRELSRAVREDTRLVPALLPVGTGLLAAALAE
jgi:predicted O-methyltransferase YrrM